MTNLEIIHKLKRRLHAISENSTNPSRAGIDFLRFLGVMLILTLLVRGTAAATTPVVTVTNPYQGTVSQSFILSGELSPGAGTPLTLPEGLLIEQVLVQPGDSVTQGQTLAVLSVDDIDTAIDQLQASLEQHQVQADQLTNADVADSFAWQQAQQQLDRAYSNYQQIVTENAQAIASAQEALDSARKALSEVEGREPQRPFEDSYWEMATPEQTETEQKYSDWQNELSNAQAAATLAAVLVGYNIILPNGERLLNEDVLNGTVLLILVTCVVSSFITERAARKIAMCEAHLEEERTVEAERILIPVANPDTIEYLMNLSLLIRDTKQKDNLLALNVINDNNTSEGLELRGKRYLEKAAMITASADVPLRQITRYDLNIAAGIIHTAKEYEVTDVIIGLHRKVNIVDSFFGMLAENLLKGLHREVMIAKFLIPINTIRRIIIAVPPKAEYEAGFQKWVEHFCRMGGTLGCRVHFFANEETTVRLQALVKKKYGQTLTDFSRLDDWGDLLILTGQVNYDHLLVVISARRGSISYDSSFEKLPAQLGKYFSNNSLIVLYPDQLGEPQDAVSFSNPRNEAQHYEKVGKWVYKWFKED